MVRQRHRTETPGNLSATKVKTRRCRARENAYLFLESVSIRGCNRIVKAPSQFIRHLWIFFLVFTSLFLSVSIMRLITEYLNYSVNIQTYVNMDAPADFPAITFCNHQPFSENAYRLWRLDQVISPSAFNRMLRQAAAQRLNDSHDPNYPIPPEAAQLALLFDSVKLYYQNLDWPHPKNLGHQRNESIYMCLFRYLGKTLVIGGSGCHDNMIQVTLRSHPHHFNCHTVSINRQYAKQVQEVGLIVWLGPRENYDARYRQAFLLDLFEQAYGLRVAIHEPGQLANLDSHGIQIEPGRMNELNFEVVQHIHMQTPRNPCITNPESKYKDLDQSYDYEFQLCLNSLVQAKVVEQCQCMYAYLPRISVPNQTLPYCGRFLTELGEQLDVQSVFQRVKCASDVLSQSAHLKKQFETEGVCLRRCESVDYVSTVSVTTWRSTQWQLHWSQETTVALDTNDANALYTYFNTANLSSVLGDEGAESESPTGQYGFSDRYTYVLVKRKSNDTTVKAENLVLTFNALVSRIGGLCSLYIGMTFAVVIELIEFFYVVICGSKKEYGQRTEKMNQPQNLDELNTIPVDEAAIIKDDPDQVMCMNGTNTSPDRPTSSRRNTGTTVSDDEQLCLGQPLVISNSEKVED